MVITLIPNIIFLYNLIILKKYKKIEDIEVLLGLSVYMTLSYGLAVIVSLIKNSL